MRKVSMRFFQVLLSVGIMFGSSAWASEWKAAVVPEIRYAGVDGNERKFEAHHWMNRGWDGGLREFTLENEDADGISVYSESRILPGNYDAYTDLKLRKGENWHFGVLASNFRKYYSSIGGVHPQGNALRVVDSGRDLFVDIGRLELEGGIKPENGPAIDLLYEYEYKNGTKSRLTWATVTDGGAARKTGPSWQELDEEVHVLEARFHDTWNGFHWAGEQKWEHFTNDTKREEKQLSVNTTASQKMVRQHFLTPKADAFTSIWDVKKWLFKDKVLASTAYRYSQIENSEVETILEMNESYQVFSFATNSHQVLPSDSTNQYRSQTGVFSVFWQVTQDWTLGLKGKLEDIRRNGQSTLNNDTVAAAGTPDRVADRFDVSNTSSDITRAGEGVSLRFTGIPNLALYNDLEFEQTDNNLNEDRTSGSAGEVFSRRTVNHAYRGVEVAGFNYRPCEGLLWAGQYRYRRDNIDYDDQFESAATSTARSAFFDGQKGKVHQVATRMKARLNAWLEPTARYQYQNYGFVSRFETADLDLRSDTTSHTTTIDLPFQILPELSLTASYQYVDLITVTPANEDTPQNYAPFHGDTSSWMLNADYSVNSKTTLTASVQYQTADNVMDVASNGVPFGADYSKIDLTVKLKHRLSETMTFEPRYDFYRYDPNENVESGEYRAHVFWLGVAIDWA